MRIINSLRIGLYGVSSWIILYTSLIYAYPWPLAPTNQQGYVYSTLDEYRSGPPVHFHDGIDIDADQNDPVYAVVGSTVDYCTDGLYVGNYGYIHVTPTVADGSQVSQGDQIGTITSASHLHFMDGPDNSEINPLRYGGIYPFDDYDYPVIDDIYLLENGTNTVVDPYNVTGPVDIVMKTHDIITDGGSNCGIYKVGYEIDNTGEVNKYQFDNWLQSSCINYVYAEGSNTTTYKYTVTNNACSDDCWDPPGIGWYTIWVYAYDIKNNWDLDYIDVYVSQTGIEEYYIRVTSPNGGEVWYYDETHDITWHTGTLAETPADSVVIHYSKDGGSIYPYRIAKVVNSSGDFPWYGSYPWTIPRNPSTTCKVRVTGYFQSDPYSHGDASDDNFTIKNPLYLSGWMEWINPPKSPKSQVEPMDVNHYRAHLYWSYNGSGSVNYYELWRKIKNPWPGDPTGWVRVYNGNNTSYVDSYDYNEGQGGWYYVRAYITGVPYIQSNTIYLAPDIPTSSFIYVWDGKEFVEDNNILARSGNEEIEEDWYKLREGPVEDGNIYRLQIREEGNEYSFFDRVRLMAIDHPDSVEIFVTPDGDIVSVSSTISSQSVMGENEVDYTSNLLNNGNIYVKANEVDKITEVLPLTVSSEDESLRFIFTDGSQIPDHIRFVKRNNAPYRIKPCPLVSATHSDIGSVKQKLLNDDENYAELLPGNTITLEFAVVGIEPEWVRDFVFVSNRYYTTEGGGGSQTAYSSIPLLHSLSLYPNPARNDMTIRFGIPREEKVSLKVYDISGREIKMLVDDRLEAGYHIIKLDSENLPSGIYFARLVTNNYELTKKLVLMK